MEGCIGLNIKPVHLPMEVGDLELMRSGLRVAQGEGGLLVQVERPLEGQVLQGLGNLEGRVLEGGAAF